MGQRYQSRKSSKRVNRILNGAIIIVAALILFLGGSLIVNWIDGRDTVVDNEETGIGESSEGETIDEGEETNDSDSESSDDSGTNDEDEGTEDEEGTEDDEDSTEEDDEGAEEDGVVPTEQTNPNPNDFTMGGQNWNEMSQALHLGAGLDEANTTIIWLGNGGSTSSARGVLLDRASGMYYDIRIEWEENVGWGVDSVSESTTNPRG